MNFDQFEIYKKKIIKIINKINFLSNEENKKKKINLKRKVYEREESNYILLLIDFS